MKSHGPENPGASGGQVGNKSQLHGPGRPDRVARKWETSGRQVKATWHPEWEASGRQAGDKLKSHGPEHPEWEASGTSGRQVKVKVTWPRAPKQVGDKWGTSGRQVKVT